MNISRIATGVLAVALLAFLATDVIAQERGGKRPDGKDAGGARGPGGARSPGGRGPGGGPNGRGGVGGGSMSIGQMSLGLLRVAQVREAIELMPDQEDALKKMASDRPERPRFDFQNASEEERQKFIANMQKQRAELAKKMQEQLEEILLPNQNDRLREIAIQVLDVNALLMPDVGEELKITDAQKTQLQEIQEKNREGMRDQMRELFQSDDRDGIREKMAEIREQNSAKLLDVLTSEQKSDFQKMKGDEFEMPEGGMRAMFAGGRPGGGRGGPGGARGGPGGGRGNFGGKRPGGEDGGQGGKRRRPEPQE